MSSAGQEPNPKPPLYRHSRQDSKIYYLPNSASQIESAIKNGTVFVIQPGNGNRIASRPSESSTYHDVTPQKFDKENPSGSIQKLVQTIPDSLRTPESRGVFFVKQIALSLLEARGQTSLRQEDISAIAHETLNALTIAIKEKHCDESLSVDEQKDALAFAASLTKATPEKVVKTLDSHLDDVAGITISNIHAAATQVREAAGNAQIAIEAPLFVPMQIGPAKSRSGFTVQVLDSDRTLSYVANAVDMMELAPKPAEPEPNSLLRGIEQLSQRNEHFERIQNDTVGNGNVAEITIEVGGREIPLHLALDIQGKLPKDNVQPFLQRVADNIAQHASKPGTVDAFVQTLVQQITIVGGDLNLTCNNLAYYAHDPKTNGDFYGSVGNARVLLVDTSNPANTRLARENKLGVQSKPNIAIVLGTNNALNPSNINEVRSLVQQNRLEGYLRSIHQQHGALRFIPSEENSHVTTVANRINATLRDALQVNPESRDTKIVAFLKVMATHIERSQLLSMFQRLPSLKIFGSLVEIIKRIDQNEDKLLDFIKNLNIEQIKSARDTIAQRFGDNPPEILMSDFDKLIKFLEEKQQDLKPRQPMTQHEGELMGATQPTKAQRQTWIQDRTEAKQQLLLQVKEVRSHAKHEGHTAHTFSFDYAGGTLHIAMTSPTLPEKELKAMWVKLGEPYEFMEEYRPEQRIGELIMSFDQGLRAHPATTAVVSVAYVVDNKTVLATYGGEKQRSYLLMKDGTVREVSKYPPELGAPNLTISNPQVITHESAIGILMIASDHPIPDERLGLLGFQNGLVKGDLITLLQMAIRQENNLEKDPDVAYQYIAFGEKTTPLQREDYQPETSPLF
ncbi:MAG: hypothetical protein QY312_01205 [Candidatus Dojkabacteria bacterium]|nr:MAG: hypothetical protein QY312_01205 [Candidatus Dojkabacteria bacterium]